jgi:hypothetical protein
MLSEVLAQPPFELIARLNHKEQVDLKKRLSDEAYRTTRARTPEPVDTVPVNAAKQSRRAKKPVRLAHKKELDNVISEIVETSREGVRITPYTETHDLGYIFDQLKRELPVTFKADQQIGYKFFLVGVTFNVLLSKDQFAKSAEFELVIGDDIDDPIHKTRPIYLFPARKDKTYFSAELEGTVAIDTSMNFHVPLTETGLIPFGEFQAKASAELKAKIVADYKYPISESIH